MEPSEKTDIATPQQEHEVSRNTDDEIEILQEGDNETIVIPRVWFNYVISAVAFLGLGFSSASRSMETRRLEDETLIRETIVTLLDEDEGLLAELVSEAGGAGSGAVNVTADDDPAKGPEDASVLIVEFSDYQCPYCGRFARETLPSLLEEYGDQVRFVYRDFPILGRASVGAALAAECADDQDQYWAYHDLLFENQESGLSDPVFLKYC